MPKGIPYEARHPRPGYEPRKTGTESGKYPSETNRVPDPAAAGRAGTGSPVTKYPEEKGRVPERGYEPKLSRAGDAGTPDIPAPRKVPPIIGKDSPRPNLSVPK